MKRIYLLLRMLFFALFYNAIYPAQESTLSDKSLSQEEQPLYKVPNFDTAKDRVQRLQHLPFYQGDQIPEIIVLADKLDNLTSIKIKDYWNTSIPSFSNNDQNCQDLHNCLIELTSTEYSNFPLNSICSRKHAFIIKQGFFNLLWMQENLNEKQAIKALYDKKIGTGKFKETYNDDQKSKKLNATYAFACTLWKYQNETIISLDPHHTKSINDLMILTTKCKYVSNYQWKKIKQEIDEATK